MAVNTKASNGIYLRDVRTANTSVVRDSAILNTTVASAAISAHGPYHAANNKLGKLITTARLAYNEAHPDD